MREKMKKLSSLLATIMICVMASPLVAFAADAEKYVPKMYASIWSLVPPVVAIALALITKEVYSSLFVGILVGGMFYSGFSFEGTITHIFQEGIVGVLSDSYNVGILIFLVILGTMVCLMNKAGGSTAFGEWASSHIKSRVGAQLATIVLGVLIFIDDYFNCLTVGSVMRPVTDAQNVSRAKLAYLIDATAAPVCSLCSFLHKVDSFFFRNDVSQFEECRLKNCEDEGLFTPEVKGGREDAVAFVKNIQSKVNAQEGNTLPVSAFKDYVDGSTPSGTAAYEKRGIAVDIPIWQSETCIQCNRCAYVCPHAAIRPVALTEESTLL